MSVNIYAPRDKRPILAIREMLIKSQEEKWDNIDRSIALEFAVLSDREARAEHITVKQNAEIKTVAEGLLNGLISTTEFRKAPPIGS